MKEKIEFNQISAGLNQKFGETSFISWQESGFNFEKTAVTCFGFVYQGKIRLITESGREFNLDPGMYFCLSEPFRIISLGFSQGIIIAQNNYQGQFLLGGPVEEKGRYCYIDGCSDSLLIPPVFLGDPCFNMLYFPAKITQTLHTHPSLRAGLIIKGTGVCELEQKEYELKPGLFFLLYPEVLHGFRTTESEMQLVVFHPDSDFGPTNTNHPMINRTIVNGIPASAIEKIQTRF